MSGEQQEKPSLDMLYQTYFSLVYNYVFYRLLHKENTEDLVSQIFLKIVRAYDQYDMSKSGLKTWVFTITENTLIDYYRRRKPTVSLDDEENSVSETLGVDFEAQYEQIASPKRRAVYEALCALPERDRTFIYKKYFLNMTNRDIANSLNMNENTVGAIMARARNKLKTLLTDVWME